MSKAMLKCYELLYEKRYQICLQESSTPEDVQRWMNAQRHQRRALYLTGNLLRGSARQFEEWYGIK